MTASSPVDKQQVIECIREYLAQELHELLSGAATVPGDIATAQLDDGQQQRVSELNGLLTVYRFLPVREYGPEDVVAPGALVELELGATRALYFIAPRGGGLITSIAGRSLQVLTPNSPLGEVLLGRKEGEVAKLESRGKVREYKVLSVK